MSEIETASKDWSARATSTIVGYVDTVRGATTGKAMVASRLAVYGIAAALVAVVMLLLSLVLLVRFLVVFSDTLGITRLFFLCSPRLGPVFTSQSVLTRTGGGGSVAADWPAPKQRYLPEPEFAAT